MAQIVLVYPPTGLDVPGLSVWLPLSLLHVAAPLVADFDVAIVDPRLDSAWRATLRGHIKDDTLAVGISSMTGTQIRGGLEAARIVREAAPDVPIVWGGVHPTLLPAETAAHPLVDCVVIGEGEATFRRWVEAAAAAPGERRWRSIDQIAFRGDDGLVVVRGGAGREAFVDPAAAPPLPYHLVDVERYVGGAGIFGRKIRSLPMVTSTGCPHKCAFCCQPVLSGGRWRAMPAERAVERAADLVARFRLGAVEFHDEEFFVDRRRGARIAEMIHGRFDWYVQTRMDDLVALDDATGLARLAAQGLKAVQPGLESGSPRVLQAIRKGETVEDFREANRRLSGSGIVSTYNFMMGYPGETEEDLFATVDLALEMIGSNPDARVAGFYVYVPYPGAALFERAVADGFRPPATLEGWSAFNRQHLLTPWVEGRRDILETLLLTSKFVDGRRLAGTFAGRPFAAATARILGARYRRMWRSHRIRRTADVRMIGALARAYFGW